MSIFIYKLTNIETGLSYIGMTQDVRKRWIVQKSQAKADKPGPLMDALREHGSDVFVQTVLEVCEDVASAYVAERKWITKLRTLEPKGYNRFLGKKWDAATKEAQRIRKTGVPHSPAHRAAGQRARKTPEYRAMMREALASSPKNKKRIAHLRKHGHLKTSLDKIRAANKAQFSDPVRRERHRQACIAAARSRANNTVH